MHEDGEDKKAENKEKDKTNSANGPTISGGLATIINVVASKRRRNKGRYRGGTKREKKNVLFDQGSLLGHGGHRLSSVLRSLRM